MEGLWGFPRDRFQVCGRGHPSSRLRGGPQRSASLQDLWDDPRTCSEDTWGLPTASRAAPASRSPRRRGPGGLRTEDSMGGGREPLQDGRTGLLGGTEAAPK